MPKKSTEEQFNAWLSEVTGKLPEAQRESFQAIAKSEAGMDIFGGYLAEKKLYQELNKLDGAKKEFEQDQMAFRDTVNNVKVWWDKSKPEYDRAIRENAAMKAQLAGQGILDDSPSATATPGAPAAPALGYPREELEELRNRVFAMDQGLPKLVGAMSKIIKASVKDNYDVDPLEVLDYSLQHGVDPQSAFTAMTAEERARREASAREAEQKKWRDEGAREALAKLPAGDNIRPASPNWVFDARSDGPDITTREGRLDAAMKTFLESPSA